MARYVITFSEHALEQFQQLDISILLRVRRAIEGKLTTKPELFGKPLRNSLAGIRSLRIGEWRVAFAIKGNTVRILGIFHRSKGYS